MPIGKAYSIYLLSNLLLAFFLCVPERALHLLLQVLIYLKLEKQVCSLKGNQLAVYLRQQLGTQVDMQKAKQDTCQEHSRNHLLSIALHPLKRKNRILGCPGYYVQYIYLASDVMNLISHSNILYHYEYIEQLFLTFVSISRGTRRIYQKKDLSNIWRDFSYQVLLGPLHHNTNVFLIVSLSMAF